MHKPSAKLLLIDDDEVVRASIAAYLEDSGFQVLQAGNIVLARQRQRVVAEPGHFFAVEVVRPVCRPVKAAEDIHQCGLA